MQPSGWSQRLLITSTMPGSLWAEHREPALLPGSPKIGCVMQPHGWLQRLLTTFTRPGSLWTAHRVASLVPSMPKFACVVHPPGCLQKRFTFFLLFLLLGGSSAGSSGSLGPALLEADLRPDRPLAGELLHPRFPHAYDDELLLMLHPSRCPHR